ncbi:MAG: hypothetical protein NC221_08730 [Duncaniella sp.]|nr:hypothetical protein [Duncaniella sp.]
MKDTSKKPAFEPVSDEEAKKIRASSGSLNPTSATECPSGENAQIVACNGKYEGDQCCYSTDIYGRCRRDGPPWDEHLICDNRLAKKDGKL